MKSPLKLFVISFIFLSLIGCSHSVKNEPQKKASNDTNVVEPAINANEPTIIETSPLVNLMTKDGISLTIQAASEDGQLSYQWYRTTNPSENTWNIINNADQNTLQIDSIDDNSIEFYYCIITNKIEDNGDGGIKTRDIKSDVFTAANIDLTIMTITTVDNEEPTFESVQAPEGLWGQGIRNATKVPAHIIMTKGDTVLYDSKEYEKDVSGGTIKVRGNTSAYGHRPHKVPYKIKLEKKADLLQNKRTDNGNYKDKEWVLLKDATSLNSMIGLEVAKSLNFCWVPEYEIVNLIINGDYKGIYLLVESIKKSNTRVNINNDGFLIERDAYWWLEDLYFITPDDPFAGAVKYTFKYPDPDDEISEDDENYQYIKDYVSNTWASVLNGTFENYIDTQSFAKWILVHDILGTKDAAGSNIYISKADKTNESKLKMETPWDFDSIYNNNSFVNSFAGIHSFGIFFFSEFFKDDYTNPAFISTYKTLYESNKDTLLLQINSFLNTIDNQSEFIDLSRKLDSYRWNNDECNSTSTDIENANSWFSSQLNWLDSEIAKMNTNN